MPWHLFGRATRRKLDDRATSAGYWKARHDELLWKYHHVDNERRGLLGQIVRLRRELNNARHYAPLQGTVFNGEVL